MVLYVEGNQEQAVAMISQAIDVDPDFWPNYENRGDMYHDLAYQAAERGATEEALEYMKKAQEDYSKAIEIHPRDPLLYVKRGQVYLDTTYYWEALQDAQQALLLEESYGEAHEMAALAYWLGFKDQRACRSHLEAAWMLYQKYHNQEGLQRLPSQPEEFLQACGWPFKTTPAP